MDTELTDKEKQELEELIETLSNIRGRHTQLVSVLIPAKQNINLVVRQLEAEKSTAANIKSHQTRDAVSDALEAIIRKLKGTKQTPPNGLAIYAGNVSEKEGVQDKVRAGGQSSQRFHRITEGLAKEFFRRVAESMKEVFFDVPNLKGILVGGPIPTKEEFLEHGDLVTKLKEKVIAVKDLGYTDEHGLKLLVESSEEEMSQQEMIKEKAIIMRFFEILGKNRTKAAYGEEKVKLAIERGAVDLLLISKKFIKENNLLAKEIEDSANEIGSSVVIVSVDNQDGEQFYNLTKGVGAILRFPIE